MYDPASYFTTLGTHAYCSQFPGLCKDNTRLFSNSEWVNHVEFRNTSAKCRPLDDGNQGSATDGRTLADSSLRWWGAGWGYAQTQTYTQGHTCTCTSARTNTSSEIDAPAPGPPLPPLRPPHPHPLNAHHSNAHQSHAGLKWTCS